MYDLAWAKQHSVIVNAVYREGRGAEDAIVLLVKQNQMLIDQLCKLEMIAPRKIKVGNETYIWRCPDELVPER